jgi:hypothetical protein
MIELFTAIFEYVKHQISWIPFTADEVNSLMECIGGVLIWLNVREIYKDKDAKGISIWTTIFFNYWCLNYFYFYASLGQWCSVVANFFYATGNITWLVLFIYYKKKNK